MIDGFLARISKCFALAGAVATIGDVCQPIAPVTLWVVVGSIFAFLVCYIARRAVPAHKEILTDGMFASGFSLLLASGVYLLQDSTEEARDRGFLAAQSDVVGRIQGDLGLVNEQLEKISKQLDGIKKEVSDDPRKELSNKGMTFTNDQFLEAVFNKDLGSIDLYVKGGMKLRDIDAERYFYDLHSEEVSDILIKSNAFQYTGNCPDLKFELWKYAGYLDAPSKVAVIKGLCGVPAFEKLIDAEIESENKSIDMIKQFNDNREKITQECLQKYPALPAGHYMEKYFKYYYGMTETPKDEPVEEAIAFTIHRDSSTARRYYGKTDSVADLAKKLCFSMNQEKEIPMEKMNRLMGIKEKLF